MAPNFGCTTRCRTLGGVTLPPASDLDHLDFEPPPFSPPKLRRCDETVATTVQHSPTPQPESPFPDVPCLSKPRLSRHFRTRTPALHFLASARGDVDELTDWLRTGGDPNSRDSDGWALLLHASVSANAEVLDIVRLCWRAVCTEVLLIGARTTMDTWIRGGLFAGCTTTVEQTTNSQLLLLLSSH